MPQPLSKVAPNASFKLGDLDAYPLEQRPELHKLAMRVISSWSALDGFVSGAFVALLGGEVGPAVAIYRELAATTTQKAAINAVGRSALSAEDAKLFREMLDARSRAAKGRNKIAHWIWGVSDGVKDGVLLVDPQTLMQARADHAAPVILRLASGEALQPSRFDDVTEALLKHHFAIQAIPREAIFVYKAKDFETIINNQLRLSAVFLAFTTYLGPERKLTDQVRGLLSRQLETRQA